MFNKKKINQKEVSKFVDDLNNGVHSEKTIDELIIELEKLGFKHKKNPKNKI